MPTIPKFSRHTYEKLGADVVDELVGWLNSVYDHKREMANLRDTMREILAEVRAVRLEIISRCGTKR
jgi:hypothetical protein